MQFIWDTFSCRLFCCNVRYNSSAVRIFSLQEQGRTTRDLRKRTVNHVLQIKFLLQIKEQPANSACLRPKKLLFSYFQTETTPRRSKIALNRLPLDFFPPGGKKARASAWAELWGRIDLAPVVRATAEINVTSRDQWRNNTSGVRTIG